MVKKQEYEGGWCDYKFCFTNNYWVPKTNTDAILANPCRHFPSFSPTKCRYPPTRLEVLYALTEHFNNNLVRLKTRPRLKSRRPFAQSAIELIESFAGHKSIAQWTQRQWLEEWKKSGVPPHSLPPPKVGNPDLGLSRSAWCKLNGNHYTDGRCHRILGPCGSGEAQTAEHFISGRCDSFWMSGTNADLASPLPALCVWLEENDLAV